MKKREIDSILERLRDISGTQKDVEMCERLGISYGTLDNWKARDSIPAKRLKQIAQDNHVNYAWLMTGEENLASMDTSRTESSNICEDQVFVPYHKEVYASAGGGVRQPQP